MIKGSLPTETIKMDAYGDGNMAHRRVGVGPLEQDEMNMHMRDRKAPGHNNGRNNPYPRVVIHVPEWLSQFTVINRGLKLVLAGVAFVACTGTYLYISGVLPDAPPSSTSRGSSIAAAHQQNGILGKAPPQGTTIPLVLSDLADINLPLVQNDIPFFAHIPRSGGNEMKKIMGQCFGLVQALDSGEKSGSKHSFKLGEFTLVNTTDMGTVVDVDVYTPDGITHAIQNGLVQSGVVQAISSQNPYLAAKLFTSHHRGRMFTFLRHPIERVVSYFYYISSPAATTDPNYSPLFGNINIVQYASTNDDRPEYNYLTKVLSNNIGKSSDELTLNDVNKAKEVLRRKMLIGLLSEKEQSIERFSRFFGWENKKEGEFCGDDMLKWENSNFNSHPLVGPTDPAWNLLWKKNMFDMDLYEYALNLFANEQKELFSGGGT